jgi:phosphotriesterase-related protein
MARKRGRRILQLTTREEKIHMSTIEDKIVMTVVGPIPASELGTTITHEHCLIDMSCWFVDSDEASRKRDVNRPIEMSMLSDLRRRPFSTTRDNMVLADEELAVRELEWFRRAGGASIVEMTCLGLSRDPLGLQRISRATGVNIVMCTGIYVEPAHPDWVRDLDSDALCDYMVKEVIEGVGTARIRCGLIGEIGVSGIPKGASEKVGVITEEEEKVLRAAGRAAKRTGLSVSVHIDPRPPRGGVIAIDILESEGVSPDRIIIDHVDQVNDIEYPFELAARGVFVEYDSLGREHYSEEWGHDFDWGHDSWRVRFVSRLIAEGYGDQLLFSQDVCMKTDLRTYGGVGYAHVLNNIVPTLQSIGVEDDAIRKILVENPRRALSFSASAAGLDSTEFRAAEVAVG